MRLFSNLRNAFSGAVSRGSRISQLNQELALTREAYSLQQRAMEDQTWVNVNTQAIDRLGLPPLAEMVRLSRLYKNKSPQGAAIVRLKTTMTFETGMKKPKSAIPQIQTVIDDLWYDPANVDTFSGFGAQIALSDQFETDANLVFVIWFSDDMRRYRIRVEEVTDVQKVIKDPEDKATRIYYRMIQRKERVDTSLYDFGVNFETAEPMLLPAVTYDAWARENPDSNLKDKATFDKCFVMHAKQNAFVSQDFGVPPGMCTLDWQQTHKDLAESLATLSRNLSQWSYTLTAKKSGATAIDALRTKLQLDTTNWNNPAPAVGSVMVKNEGVSLEPVNVQTGGANVIVNSLREFLLQVSAGSGFPEPYFGSARGGSFGLMTGMELPVLKMIRMRQALIAEEVYKRPIVAILDRHPLTRNMTAQEKNTIDVDFPLPFERDLVALATSLQTGLQNNLISQEIAAEQFLGALGVNNIEEVVEELMQTIQDEAKKVAAIQAPPFQANPLLAPPGQAPPFQSGQPHGSGSPQAESRKQGGTGSAEQRGNFATQEARIGYISRVASDVNRLIAIGKIASGNNGG